MKFEISTECDWLSFSKTSGEIALCERITLYIDRHKLIGRQLGSFTVHGVDFPARATFFVEAESREDIPGKCFHRERRVYLYESGELSGEARYL